MQTSYTFGIAALSSLERVAFYLNLDIGQGRVNGVNNDSELQRRTRRSIMAWILEISASFQNYCQREFIIQSRVQFFDCFTPKMSFFPTAVPIVSITEVANDPLGLFTGGQWTLNIDTDVHLEVTGNSFTTVFNVLVYGNNSVRLTYVGGLCYDPVNSLYVTKTEAGSSNITPGVYAYGNTSGSLGKVVSYSSSGHQITIASLAGAFQANETVTFQPSIYAQDIAATSVVLSSITQQSLVEAFPDIARAIDIEVRYMQKHEFDYENQSDGGRYGATRRNALTHDDQFITLQPETLRIMDNYRRYLVGS